jgi:microcystin-dependent protein
MSQVIDTSIILLYSGSIAPSGYLLCNGQAISRTNYSDLFTLIGTTYGPGDGSSTFNIPNLNGYFPIMGPSLGSTGGANAITLSELPSHTHGASNLSIGNHTHSLTFGNSANYVYDVNDTNNAATGSGLYKNYSNSTNLPSSTNSTTANLTGSVNTNNTGQANSISILNTYIVLNYIIKT